MTPDELRALADEMQSNIDEVRIILRGKITVEDKAWFAMHDKAIDYLRACSEAEPVARLLHWHGPKPDPRTVIVARTFDEYSVQEADDPKSYWENGEPLYTHPAPAAPQAEPSAALIRAYNSGYMQGHHDTVESCFTDIHQSDMDTFHADLVAELGLSAAPQAEPCIGNDSACPCQDGDACHYKDAADGTKAWPVPQAEPKREPLTALRILEIEDNASRQWRDNGRIIEYAVVFARMIERAHGIGGSDAE